VPFGRRPDHSFDLTISVFGAMFAPKPFRCRQGDGAPLRNQAGAS